MGRKPHIFIRIGEILFQCTEEGGPMHPSKDDMSVSPHWAFSIEPKSIGKGSAIIGLRKVRCLNYGISIPFSVPVNLARTISMA
jgi:hypothetical protein